MDMVSSLAPKTVGFHCNYNRVNSMTSEIGHLSLSAPVSYHMHGFYMLLCHIAVTGYFVFERLSSAFS